MATNVPPPTDNAEESVYTLITIDQCQLWEHDVLVRAFVDKGITLNRFEFPVGVSEWFDLLSSSTHIILSFLGDGVSTLPESTIYGSTLAIQKACRDMDMHLTCLIQEYMWRDRDRCRTLRHLMTLDSTVLYVTMGMVFDDDVTEDRNMLRRMLQRMHEFDVDGVYSITVVNDMFPLLVTCVREKYGGVYTLSHPHVLEYTSIVQICSPLASSLISHDDVVTTTFFPSHTYDDDEANDDKGDGCLPGYVLPAYQAVQRLVKRIRKAKVHGLKMTLGTVECVCVTGGYGFIGSNFVRYLFDAYPQLTIINIDRVDVCSRREHLMDLEETPRVISYETDLCETERVTEILETRDVDVVFHLAAQSHVDHSFNNSLQFSKDNVYATHSLLEACKNYGKVVRFIHVSTDEVYGETLQYQPFHEGDVLNPTNPYAATKVGAESIARSYSHCFEVPVIIVRGNNVYGPRQYPEKMIPKFILALLDGQPCTLAGNGLMKRCFVYVDDMCRALVRVAEDGKVDETYNIGTDNEHSVVDIARRLIDEIRSSAYDHRLYMVSIPDRYYNDFRYCIDASKIRTLGWQPQVEFSDGLRRTIEYYTHHRTLYAP
jgi:dTDP-glucose 4,6-dehydratase